MAKNWRKAGAADALARGLQGAGGDLLFGTDDRLRETVSLRLSDVLPNPDQPRRHFDEEELQQLASSLRSVGQLAPILVKPHPTERRRYLLVAGERRWRAAALAELATIAAHILTNDADVDQIALIENLQRVNLSPVEEAEGVQRLIDRHRYSQEQAGTLLGRSRTEVNTALTLLRLAPAIRQDCVTSHTDMPKALLLEIARMDAAEQAAAWEQAKAGELTARTARAQRRGVAEEEGTRPGSGSGSGPSSGRDTGVSPTRFIAALPKLQSGLDAGLAALQTERPALRPKDRERLQALRARLANYAAAIDSILEG